jgi:hypothetical protein
MMQSKLKNVEQLEVSNDQQEEKSNLLDLKPKEQEE